MELAFSQAVEYLKIKFGPDMNLWGWGKIHTLSIPHVLGRNPVLGRIFNRGPYPIGGDADTIWNTQATRFDFSQKSIVGPPYRMIIDFSDLSKSVSQLLPGQSGHPASSHYADNISSWINGEYHPMLFRFTDVKKFAEARMRLEPD